MKKYLISIICPVYNSLGKIEKLLESLEEQSYEKYEVIFVDDGSTDRSYAFLNTYSQDKKNIQVIRQKNMGPGVARMNGFKRSTGELIYFIDSDDWLADKNTLSRINKVFSSNEEISICIAKRKVYPSGEVLGAFDGSDLEPGIYSLDIFYSNQIYGNMSMKVFRRNTLFEKSFVGAFNFEDLATSYLALDKCTTIKYVNDYFYISNHSKNKQSLTTRKDYMIKTLPERAENLLKAISLAKTPQIRTALASAAFNTYCIFIKHGGQKKHKNLMNLLRDTYLRYDLSGFYYMYNLGKRVILTLQGMRKRRNED